MSPASAESGSWVKSVATRADICVMAQRWGAGIGKGDGANGLKGEGGQWRVVRVLPLDPSHPAKERLSSPSTAWGGWVGGGRPAHERGC